MKNLIALLALTILACNPVPTPSGTPTLEPTASAGPTASTEPSVEPSPTPVETATPEVSEEPTPSASEPVALVFVGEGSDTTEEFALPADEFVVTWDVAGGPCTIDFTLVLPDYGDRYPVGHAATNDVAHGEITLELPGGFYELEVVDPGCLWTVEIERR